MTPEVCRLFSEATSRRHIVAFRFVSGGRSSPPLNMYASGWVGLLVTFVLSYIMVGVPSKAVSEVGNQSFVRSCHRRSRRCDLTSRPIRVCCTTGFDFCRFTRLANQTQEPTERITSGSASPRPPRPRERSAHEDVRRPRNIAVTICSITIRK
jgi:hypothetical protein